MIAGSPITTHVLDANRGRPAAGVAVELERLESPNRWRELARKSTDADGRIRDLLPPGAVTPGTYRLRFHVEDYFRRQGAACFYPHVEVCFSIQDAGQHYHVPLLLSPYGYSTYRGS